MQALNHADTAARMSDDELLDFWAKVIDGDMLNPLAEAVLNEIERRNLDI
jgi:hypothetical protein